MKNTLSKLVLAGAVLAATLSAASAATRHTRVNEDAGYAYGTSNFSNTANQYSDDEQRRRDIGGQGG